MKYTIAPFFAKEYPITQKYGENPGSYPIFTVPGHEGTDYGTPNGTPVKAPFNGIILRDTFADKDYGNFTVVWDKTQNCALWFCHLQDLTTKVGDIVSVGQVIGHTNNTGHSTGPHCHVNFVETDSQGNRLNTNNGKQGFLDLLAYTNSQTISPDLQKEFDQCRLDRDTNHNLSLALFNALGVPLDPNNKENSKIEGVNGILKLFKQHDDDTRYIADIKNTDSKILEQDGHLAEQLLDAQKLTKAVSAERQSLLDKLGVSTTQDGLNAIVALQTPHDEVVKNVQPVLDGLAEAAIRKSRSPQVKSTLQKIIDFLRGK